MPVYYDDTEYELAYKIENEVRIRQVPQHHTYVDVQTRYRAGEEERYTTEFEVLYKVAEL